jgi:hypothetical protein
MHLVVVHTEMKALYRKLVVTRPGSGYVRSLTQTKTILRFWTQNHA